MARKKASELRKEEQLMLLQVDIDHARRCVLEAENDIKEAQERLVNETDIFESLKAQYADILSGRTPT